MPVRRRTSEGLRAEIIAVRDELDELTKAEMADGPNVTYEDIGDVRRITIEGYNEWILRQHELWLKRKKLNAKLKRLRVELEKALKAEAIQEAALIIAKNCPKAIVALGQR